MGGAPIDHSTVSQKLRCYSVQQLKWERTYRNVATIARKWRDVLNGHKYKPDRKILERLYFAFIRSKLDYASIVWDNCPKELFDIIENV